MLLETWFLKIIIGQKLGKKQYHVILCIISEFMKYVSILRINSYNQSTHRVFWKITANESKHAHMFNDRACRSKERVFCSSNMSSFMWYSSYFIIIKYLVLLYHRTGYWDYVTWYLNMALAICIYPCKLRPFSTINVHFSFLILQVYD